MCSEMNAVEIVTALKDMALGASAVVGAVVAVRGLRSWKAQLRGKDEYLLSRRLLKESHKYRDAIRNVRSPLMMGHEMPEPPPDSDIDPRSQAGRHYGRQQAYIKRWEPVQKCRSQLYPDLVEAEVSWGNRLDDLMKPLFELERDLFFAIQDQLEVEDPGIDRSEKEYLAERERSKERRATLWGVRSGQEDKFATAFDKAFSESMAYLKQKVAK